MCKIAEKVLLLFPKEKKTMNNNKINKDQI